MNISNLATGPECVPSFVDLLAVPVFVIRYVEGSGYLVHHVNRCYERQTGVDAEQVVGRPILDWLPPRIAETVTRNYDACEAVGDALSYEQTLDLGGRESWWRTTLTAVSTSDEGHPVIVGVSTDITEAKLAEFAAAKEIARLSRNHDDMRAVAGLTAHDMRGPLASIIMANKLVLDGFDDPDGNRRNLIEMTSRVAQKCLETIDETMERVTCIDTAAETDSEIDLGRLCRDLAALADPNHALEISTPEATVRADKVTLQLALRNLLDNAARYCWSSIDIEFDPLDDHPGMIAMTVRDDGPGFPKDFHLQEVKLRDAEPESGARGFGLVTIGGLVRSRGGAISICHEDGRRGAGIRITVPGWVLSDAELPRTANVPDDRPGAIATKGQVGPARIIVADDNPTNLLVVKTMLGKLGLTAETATNGAEAVELAERGPPAMILMDIHMPRMTGIEATAAIRARHPDADIRVVAITADPKVGDRSDYRSAGFEKLIAKPVRIETLTEVMQSFIDRNDTAA